MISTNNIIVLCAFAAYLVMMIVIGFVYSKSTKNNEDYFLGGRNLGGWTAALSAQFVLTECFRALTKTRLSLLMHTMTPLLL